MRVSVRYGLSLCALSAAFAGCGAPGEEAQSVGELVAGLNEDGVNQRIEIPLVVVLWQNASFGGRKRVFVQDQPTLAAGSTTPREVCQRISSDQNLCSFQCVGGPDFNDIASAVGVHPGPDFDSFVARTGRQPTVTLWSDAGFSGRSIKLAAGTYPDLGALGFNDAASSLSLDDSATRGQSTILPVGPAAPFPSIPYVVQLHSASSSRAIGCQESDTVITLVESSASLGADYGFDKAASWVELLHGTGGVGSSVRLYTDPGFGGSSIASSTFGSWTIDAAGFNDLTSSVKINGPLRLIWDR